MEATHHLWTPDLHDFAIRFSQRCLAANHVCAVAEHGYANERVGVVVPAHHRLVVFPRTATNALIFRIGLLLQLDSLTLIGSLLARLYGDVDVTDFQVHGRNELNARDLGDNGQCLWAVPCIVDEGCVPKKV